MSSSTSSSPLKATLIVAQDAMRGIGSNGGLPWKLSKEMKYFAQATTAAPSGKQNAVIMGRTTWEGIPAKFRPLKNRINLVLSSKSREDLQLPENVLQATSLSKAMAKLAEDSDLRKNLHRVYIIGGAQLYKAALEIPDIADRILLTQITRGSDKWSCDTFFPELDSQAWQQATQQEHQDWLQGVEFSTSEVTEGEVAWEYQIWTRRSSNI